MRAICFLLIALFESTSEEETENAGDKKLPHSRGHGIHLSTKSKRRSTSWGEGWNSCFLALNYFCASLEQRFYFTFFFSFFSCLRWKPKGELSAPLILWLG